MSGADNPALDPAQSVTLLASAGTGKTWTLTARIVRLLLAGAEPGGLLALTFTRKAAAEMRERVTARLEALAFADDAALGRQLAEIGAADDDATRERARGLFEATLYAPIPLRASTLHVFCAEVLGRFALEAEVPAGFALLENERELRQQAIESVLHRAHRDAAGPLALALDALAAEGLSEFDLRGLLHSLFERRQEVWAAAEGHADPLEGLSQQLASALPYRADEDPYAATEAPAVLARLKMLAAMLQELGPVGTVKGEPLAAALECQGAARYAVLRQVLYTQAGKARAFNPAAGRYTPPQRDTVCAHFAAVSEAIAQASDALLRAATYRRTRAALTLGLAALEAFAQGLHRAGQLGFAELEWQTVRLLRREGSADWVRYKLDQRLQHVLLDEFQDTSPTQWRLLLPLLQEFAGRQDSRRTVFLVGDGKQSIYGFRRAEPRLLQVAGDWLQAHLGAVTASLDESRRSAPAILRFVNALFAGETGERIGFAPHRTALGALCGAVEVAPLIEPAAEDAAAEDAESGAAAANDAGRTLRLRNPLTTPREEGEDQRAGEEAHWVVDRITQLVEQRTPVTLRDGHSRALHHGDVMVLARHRTHLGVLERALGAAGIPYSTATRATLLDTALAQDLLALLAALDGPHRNLELAHALRSPWFSVGDDELLWLARQAQAAACPWWSALMAAGPAADCPASLQRAAGLLARWQALAQQLPPHDLIDRLASEGDLLRRCRAARPQDSLVAANLSALLQLALDSDHGRYPTLGGFLRHCAELGQSQGPDEAPPPSSEARVQVMTVHAAKGLEAPAVFLVNAAPSPRAAHAGWRVDWPAEAERPGVLVHAGKSEQREGLSRRLIEAEQAREQRESLNLLYVAVTRAQQYLFVSGFQSGRGPQAESWHARCRAAVAALLPEPPAPQHLAAYAEGAAPRQVGADLPAPTTAPLETQLLQPLPAPAVERGPLPAVEARQPEAVLRGQAIHALLQHLSAGRSALPLAEAALRARVQQQLAVTLPESLWQSAYTEALAVYRAPALQAFFDPSHRAWNEVALHVQTEDGPQVNVLDRLVDTGEGLWVLDYKTHRRDSGPAILAAATPQLQRYLAAVQRLFPQRPVRAAVIWTPEAALLPL